MRPDHPETRRWPLLTVAVLWLTACGDDFVPASQLGTAPQILAIRAEPPMVAAGERTTLDALVHWPGATPTLVYLVCVPDVGDSLTSCLAGRFDAAAGVPLCAADPSARLCLAGVGPTAEYVLPPGFFPDDGQAHTFFVNVLATSSPEGLLACADTLGTGRPTDDCLLGLKRVAVTGGTAPNRNPVVAAFLLEGDPVDATSPYPVALHATPVESLSLEVGLVVDASSVDEVDAGTPFDLVVAWYSDCGTLDPDLALIPCEPGTALAPAHCDPSSVTWKPGVTGRCSAHAVVRDTVGGIGFGTLVVDVE
jgi:hypothetical protein